MRIAQVAQLWESVPPKMYGGSERVISYLTEELVRQGHDVTLFASGDSITAARLEGVYPEALRLSTGCIHKDAVLVALLERTFGSDGRFDIIHSHLEVLGFPMARRCQTPVVSTLHGRLDLPELVPVFNDFTELPIVSISDAQRTPFPWSNWVGTIYHGLPSNLYTFHPTPGKYLAFLGRIAPEKRPDHAIEIAKRLGIPLRIAAKVDPANRAYFEAEIKPLLDHPLIEFVGEITDTEKDQFLGEAYGLLAPYDWPEPFGLVLIEALACGTPLLAYRCGSIPEILEDGVTGMICESVADMEVAVSRLDSISRANCRRSFEERFTVERMAQEYLRIYSQFLNRGSRSTLASVGWDHDGGTSGHLRRPGGTDRRHIKVIRTTVR